MRWPAAPPVVSSSELEHLGDGLDWPESMLVENATSLPIEVSDYEDYIRWCSRHFQLAHSLGAVQRETFAGALNNANARCQKIPKKVQSDSDIK